MKVISLSPSKSVVNRNLVIASYGLPLPDVSADSEDVVDLYRALSRLGDGDYAIRQGGTTFRFLMARLSRIPGRHSIVCAPSLLSRPHSELYQTLTDLGCHIEQEHSKVTIQTEGWRRREAWIDCTRSSQFASAVLLNTFDLPEVFRLNLLGRTASSGYLNMTVDMLARAGLNISDNGTSVEVSPTPGPIGTNYMEIDVSSAFSIAAIAAVSRPILIEDFPTESLQPDFRFVEILRRLGVQVEIRDEGLKVLPGEIRGGLEEDLSGSPDLFPVLASLCALSKNASRLKGLGNLQYKESDRLQKTVELLRAVGANVEADSDCLEVSGPVVGGAFEFDPAQDHRMAMAAGVLKKSGCQILIKEPDVVEKSYLNFWRDAEITPESF